MLIILDLEESLRAQILTAASATSSDESVDAVCRHAVMMRTDDRADVVVAELSDKVSAGYTFLHDVHDALKNIAFSVAHDDDDDGEGLELGARNWCSSWAGTTFWRRARQRRRPAVDISARNAFHTQIWSAYVFSPLKKDMDAERSSFLLQTCSVSSCKFLRWKVR